MVFFDVATGFIALAWMVAKLIGIVFNYSLQAKVEVNVSLQWHKGGFLFLMQFN